MRRRIWLALLTGGLAADSMAGLALDLATEAIGPPRGAHVNTIPAPGDTRASMQAHIRAQAARSRGDHRAALSAWRDAVLADQSNAAAWRGIALSSEEMGLRDAAASAWKRRLDLAPEDFRAQGIIGEALARGGDQTDGLALLLSCRGRDSEGRAIDSTLPYTRDLLIVEGLRTLGHGEAAAEVEEALARSLPAAAVAEGPADRNDARWLLLLQRAARAGLLQTGALTATARARHADALEPELRGVDRARARASAARFYAAALALHARQGTSASEIVALISAGARDGHIRLAPLIRWEMPIAEAVWRTGGIALQLGQDALARDLLKRAVELDEGDARFRNSLGWVLLLEEGASAAAESHLEAALTAAPDDAAILDSVGLLRLTQGRAEEALPLLVQARVLAVESSPVRDREGRPVEDPEILLHLGDAHAAAGEAHAAQVIWMLALEQLTGPIGRWRLAQQAPLQRREWGLEVIGDVELYDLRFGWLEQALRERLAGASPQNEP